MKNKEKIRKVVRRNYSEVALKGSSGGGCCSGGCGCNSHGVEVSTLKIGYKDEDLLNTPRDSNMGLGCGNPIAIASLKKGEVVLDLGSGVDLIAF